MQSWPLAFWRPVAERARRPKLSPRKVISQPLHRLRDVGRRTDFSLSAAKVGKQFQTAEQLGARIAILVGDEWPMVKVKTLATREERLVAVEDVIQASGL